MKKPFNVMSKVALASVFTASALLPVASVSAEAPAEYKLKDAVFTDGEYLAKYDLKRYVTQLALNKVDDTVTHVTFVGGETYKIKDYVTQYALKNGNEEKVYEALKGKEINNKIYEGYIDDNGKVRAKVDEQPEDRLNETFFYNAA